MQRLNPDKPEIANNKQQITNKFQYPNLTNLDSVMPAKAGIQK
jgi:hypothetical protein